LKFILEQKKLGENKQLGGVGDAKRTWSGKTRKGNFKRQTRKGLPVPKSQGEKQNPLLDLTNMVGGGRKHRLIRTQKLAAARKGNCGVTRPKARKWGGGRKKTQVLTKPGKQSGQEIANWPRGNLMFRGGHEKGGGRVE